MKAILHKILTIASAMALAITSVNAQNEQMTKRFGATAADSLECVKNQSLYLGFYEQKNYETALPYWRQNFYECPASSENIYIRGQVMYQAFYDQTKDKAYLDTLMQILDKRSEYFGNKTGNDFRKAFFLHGYSQNHPELMMESYKILNSYLIDQPEVITSDVVMTQIINSVNLYARRQIKQEDVINDYSRIMNVLDNLAKSGAGAAQISDVRNVVDNLFRQCGVATCENIIPLFQPQVKERPDDTGLLKKVISLLDNAGCTTSDLYYTSVENLYKLEKSAAAAYHLAELNVQKDRLGDAEKYYLEAVAMETDPLYKSNYLTKLGTLELNMKNYPKARDYARQVIELNPNSGTAHFIIGSAYAGTRLGDDDFENKTVFWIAVDYFIKAKNLDASLTDRANESIAVCSANFPKKDEAFFVGIYDEGTPYTVKGWINERTTVRFRN
jgi:tetratricopeptide (TPR) repeat protein